MSSLERSPIVTDVPQACDQALYDEAAAHYAELVRPRAKAVYRIGRTSSNPGLSGIDLLVVTDRIGIDNRYYFSALSRLPRRCHPLFLHEPYILPAWSLRIAQHAPAGSRALLAGRDVLHSYVPSDSPDEQWCRLLEAYCSYAAFVQRIRGGGALKGRLTVSVASAFREMLAQASPLFGPFETQVYSQEVDALLAGFFKREDRTLNVLAAWDLFTKNFAQFEERMQSWLGAAQPALAPAMARALLRGDETCDAFDRDYAFRRARDIDGYHMELASLGFPYGHLFMIAAHPGAVRRLPDAPVVSNLVRNIYRVRRRLTEYGARV